MIHIEGVYDEQDELKVILGGEEGPPLFLELTFSKYGGYRSFDESPCRLQAQCNL